MNEIVLTIIVVFFVFSFIVYFKKDLPKLKHRNTCPKCKSVFENKLIANPKTGEFPKTWFVSYKFYTQWRECKKCKFKWKTQEEIHSDGGGA